MGISYADVIGKLANSESNFRFFSSVLPENLKIKLKRWEMKEKKNTQKKPNKCLLHAHTYTKGNQIETKQQNKLKTKLS